VRVKLSVGRLGVGFSPFPALLHFSSLSVFCGTTNLRLTNFYFSFGFWEASAHLNLRHNPLPVFFFLFPEIGLLLTALSQRKYAWSTPPPLGLKDVPKLHAPPGCVAGRISPLVPRTPFFIFLSRDFFLRHDAPFFNNYVFNLNGRVPGWFDEWHQPLSLVAPRLMSPGPCICCPPTSPSPFAEFSQDPLIFPPSSNTFFSRLSDRSGDLFNPILSFLMKPPSASRGSPRDSPPHVSVSGLSIFSSLHLSMMVFFFFYFLVILE